MVEASTFNEWALKRKLSYSERRDVIRALRDRGKTIHDVDKDELEEILEQIAHSANALTRLIELISSFF